MDSRTWFVTTESFDARGMSADEVMEGLRAVCAGDSEFFVVEPEKDCEDSFAQASKWTGGVVLGRSYVAEVRVPADRGFRQWRLRTKDFGLIEDAVRGYLAGESPSIKGWEDVTDEFADS